MYPVHPINGPYPMSAVPVQPIVVPVGPQVVDNYYDPQQFFDESNRSDSRSRSTDDEYADQHDIPSSRHHHHHHHRHHHHNHHQHRHPHSSHHHPHEDDRIPKLPIFRHRSKAATDPSAIDLAAEYRTPTIDQQYPRAPVNVTIKRHTPAQVSAQIVPYPVPVYVPVPVSSQSHQTSVPVPQIELAVPVRQPSPPVVELPPPPPIAVQVHKWTPKKTQVPPPTDNDRYETESFHLPESKPRSKKDSRPVARNPIRMDVPLESSRRTNRVPVETNEGPSYRAVSKGATTREMENEAIDQTGEMIDHPPLATQEITYRDHSRRK